MYSARGRISRLFAYCSSDVRRPTGNTADGENWREQVDRNAERVVRGRRVEIDVRVQLLLALDESLDPLRHLEPDRLSRPLPEIARHLSEVGRARILGVIHAMAETGDLLLAREFGSDQFLGLLGGTVLPDFQQHSHDVGVRSAVQRSFERADRADDRRVQVAQRRGNHPGSERRRIQLVVGVKDQRYVERPRREAARPVAREHVEEVGRVAKDRIRSNGSTARTDAPHRRDERAELGRQPHGLAVVRLRRAVRGVRIVVRERRSQRAQGVHPIVAGAADAIRGSPRMRRMTGSGMGALRRAPTGDRRARREPEDADARADSRPPRTSHAAQDRGCRNRSKPERLDRHPGSRWTRQWQQCPRAPPWASLQCWS